MANQASSASITTLQGHILEQQGRYPDATGLFTWILSALSISAKIIADRLRRADRLERSYSLHRIRAKAAAYRSSEGSSRFGRPTA